MSREGAVQHGSKASPQSIAAAAIALHADQLAGRAVTALDRASVPSLLLRGPVLARWLYEDPSQRRYADADLLVPVALHERAAEVLADMGLSELLAGAAESEQFHHARTFVDGVGGSVDLHRTLGGVAADASEVWEPLAASSSVMELAGASVETPRPAVRALIVALHAAQHGPQGPVQLEDARRAAEAVLLDDWREAAGLADRLAALPAFVAGLTSSEAGVRVARELGVASPMTDDLAVRAQGNVPTLRGIARLAGEPTLKAKVALLLRELWPTTAFMREWSRLARRGLAGLAAAHVFRPLWLLWHAPPALRAYRRARRVGR